MQKKQWLLAISWAAHTTHIITSNGTRTKHHGPSVCYQQPRGLFCWYWLTHWGWDKMAAIFQTTFSNVFSCMKMYEFWERFHWRFFLRVQLTIFQHLVQIMAWLPPGNKPLSEPMMVSLSTHICVTQPQWVHVNPSMDEVSKFFRKCQMKLLFNSQTPSVQPW